MWDIPDVSDPARRGKNLGYIYGGGFFRIPNLYQWRTGRGSGDPDEKTYMDRVMNRVFTFQGSGCRNCHSSSRQKPYQIRNPGYSGFGISGPCKHTERTAGTQEAAVPLRSVSVSCLGLLWYMSEPGQKNLLFLIWSVSVWQDIRYAPWYIIFSSSHEALVCPGNYDLLSDPFLHDPA